MSKRHNKRRQNVPPKIIDNTDGEIRQMMANDAYANSAAGLGWNAENLTESTTYPLTRLTQNYMLMLSLYRSSGILRRIIDKPVEDAVSHWFKIDSQLTPEQLDALGRLARRTNIKAKISEGLRWGYLFGGAAGLMIIDGQGDQLDQPLDLKAIEPDSFKGIHIVDRWSGIYASDTLVDDINDPDFGLPDTYEIREDEQSAVSVTVHHSRILRFTGDELPYWERQLEQEWGISRVETVFESLKRYDNTLGNIANLVWQANVWTQKTDNIDTLLGMAPNAMKQNFIQTLHAQQRLMDSFSTRLIGKDDDLQNHPYSFSGLDKVFEIFQYDMSSVSGIPVTVLFGRSAAGLDSTGDADMDNYYTMLESIQENKIRPVLEQLLPVMCMSEFGAVPDDLKISFNPVRVPTEKEKADIASSKVNSIVSAHSEGLITDKIGMKELHALQDTTGMFSNITDQDIHNADDKPDMGDMPLEQEESQEEEKPLNQQAQDSDYEESKHPRSPDGKFKEKGQSADISAQNKQLTNENNSDRINSPQRINSTGRNTIRYGFSRENLDRHWNEHKNMYPRMTKKQYAARALDLVQSAADGKNILGYATKAGAVVRYDVKANDYAKGYPNGGITTMFKPTLGIEYFYKWKHKEGISDDS